MEGKKRKRKLNDSVVSDEVEPTKLENVESGSPGDRSPTKQALDLVFRAWITGVCIF
jgi:hypothetical protein